jgi:hypothetical protein
MKKTVSVRYEVSGDADADLFELMDEHLSDDELLQYLKDRKIEYNISNMIVDDFERIRVKLLDDKDSRAEQLIRQTASWPEFIPTLLDMHFRGVIDINALYQEIKRNIKQPGGRQHEFEICQ